MLSSLKASKECKRQVKTCVSLHLCTGCLLATGFSRDNLAWIGARAEASSLCLGSVGKLQLFTCLNNM